MPNHKQLMAVAEQMGIKGTWEEICNNPQMEKEVLCIITEAAISGRETILTVKQNKNSPFSSNIPASVGLTFCCPPTRQTGAIWDSQEDPSECRTLDTRDRFGHWRFQTEAKGAENTLSGRHRENVRGEIRRIHYKKHTQPEHVNKKLNPNWTSLRGLVF